MNVFERQADVGRQLFEVNTSWWRKLAEFDSETFRRYVEFNQDFAKRLTEVKDLQSFTELQREYGESLWSGAQDAIKERNEMLRDVAEANGELLRGMFSPEEKAKKSKAKAA